MGMGGENISLMPLICQCGMPCIGGDPVLVLFPGKRNCLHATRDITSDKKLLQASISLAPPSVIS